MFKFFKKPTNETTTIYLVDYPDEATLKKIIGAADEANTSPETSIKIIYTLTRETLAERTCGKWEMNWSAEEAEITNVLCNLLKLQLA